MEITPLGHASFRIKGKKGVVVTDPFDTDMVGLKFPKVTADIVTVSHNHPDHNQAGAVGKKGEELIVLTGPGEYEIRGIEILGIAAFHDNQQGKGGGKNIIFRLEMDGLSIVHLGDLGHKLSEEQLDALDGVDIVMVPVGGTYTINATEAVDVVAQLEPLIVIPMHYFRPELNQANFGKLTPLDAFLKAIGNEVKAQPQLTITKDQLPQDLQVVVLE